MVWLVAAALAIEVPAGIYTVEGREIWVEAFELSDTLNLNDGACREAKQRVPSADEWLVAAQLPGFKASDRFELVNGPQTEACEFSMAVLEAEGVEGWIHFAGWGASVGESQVLSGKGDPRAGHLRIHQNPWHFWGDEAKPAPRGERCVVKSTDTATETAFARAPVTLRSGRKGEHVDVFKVAKDARLTVLHKQGEWALVSAQKRVPDGAGSEPRVWSCGMEGWAPQSVLAPERATTAFSPGGELGLATWCPADPNAFENCLLPWSKPADGPGWIGLDPTDFASKCHDGGPSTQAYRDSSVKPLKLHIKIPKGEPDRGVIVRARTMLGQRADGEYTAKGYGPWRSVDVKAYDLQAGGGVLDASMSQILGEADHKVQLEIEITGLPVYTVDLIWPVSC